jgi:hypothetical protein
MTASAVAFPSFPDFFEMPRSWIDSAYKGVDSWSAFSWPLPVERPVSQIGDNDIAALLASPLDQSSPPADGCEFGASALAILEVARSRMVGFAAIDSFNNLPTDWGGPDTVLPPPDTREAAKALVAGLPASVATPHASPSADGEIGFTWVTATKRVDALLDVDGHLVWFWHSNGRISPGGEVTYDGSFPDDLLKVLEA